MQFYRTVLFILTIFLGVLAYFWMSLGHFNVDDQYAYEKLIQGDEEVGNHHSHTSTQSRIGLQKDLYVNRNGQPLQALLKSEKAELAFEKRDGKLEIIEKMQHVTCCIQEEKYFLLEDEHEGFTKKPMQIIAVFTANDASYYYQKNLLVGENMAVTRYLVAGDTLQSNFQPLQTLSSGIAGKASFEIGSHFNFHAEKFKAKMYGNP